MKEGTVPSSRICWWGDARQYCQQRMAQLSFDNIGSMICLTGISWVDEQAQACWMFGGIACEGLEG